MRWSDTRSARWAVLAGLIGGTAVLVKAVAAFFVVGPFAAVCLAVLGIGGATRNRQVWLMGALISLPALVFTWYGVVVQGTLGSQFSGRFFLSVLVQPDHYLMWFSAIVKATGIFLPVGVLGLYLVRGRDARALLSGWWLGYLLYSLALPYHAATHDYYQLPLIPLVAVSLSPTASRVAQELAAGPRRLNRVGAALVAGTTVISAGLVAVAANLTMTGSDTHAESEFWSSLRPLVTESGGRQLPVIGLTPDYGQRASFWGWFQVDPWPQRRDEAYARLQGVADRPFTEQFDSLTRDEAFFLIVGEAEIARQPELAAHLARHYGRVSTRDGVLLYDLRSGPDAESASSGS